MDTRREFIKKASILSGATGLMHILPPAIQKALAINPAPGSTYLDAEHIVLLMQENRSFDHTYGTLQGVRGFNDPRAITLPNKNTVWLQTNEKGETFAPFRFDIKGTKATWMSSLPHGWADQVDARNNGKYDQWLISKRSGHQEYAAMPLTMGYYTREDIPFYYSLADAFTVCDHNFCSSLTGTTPNRLYFWTGTIREKPDTQSMANVWNEDADYDSMVSWMTFPERLEENGISWKVYQNELSVGVGFTSEEDDWLANFGDNPLEYFTQYQVKLSAEYIDNLPKAAASLATEIKKQEQQLTTLAASSPEAAKTQKRIDQLKKQLADNEADQKQYTRERYERLSQREKNIHNKAFSTNRKDPFYHELTALQYQDGDTQREVHIPKGDILHQFREDVNKGALPTVSWIVAPATFSDHPGSAWYGAWYISEVMDILTKNPEVWKKTIFILTYDENDGYFDHLPPFVPPHPNKPETGLTSKNIPTGEEYVGLQQQSRQSNARESSIGLGYRVPLVIASPWSRGGWVNSEVFDHTSSLRFLEKFLSHKTGKKIEESNISAWRRTVCGDLTSAFRPYNGEKIANPVFLEKEEFIESIHKAQFKNAPSNYKSLTASEIKQANVYPQTASFMPVQEKGIRSSCALPYELYVDAAVDTDKRSIRISFKAGNKVFGNASAGCPFHVYAPGIFREEAVRTWAYAVAAGDLLQDSWRINDFEHDRYHLRVYGPNGFFREFAGAPDDPGVHVVCEYERNKTNGQLPTGNISLQLINTGKQPQVIEITDRAYKTAKRTITLGAAGSANAQAAVIFSLANSHNWYDLSVGLKDHASFIRCYAGRVETGKAGKSDPLMGMVK
jgi:phospholipase C